MATWYYYNEQDEKIEVTGRQLKGLAKAGMITPDTIVETEDGKKAPARKVKGLTFIAAAQPETESPESAPLVETEIYGLAESKPPVEEKPPTTPVPEEENPFAVSVPEEVNPFAVSVQEEIASLTFALATEENPFAAAMQMQESEYSFAAQEPMVNRAMPLDVSVPNIEKKETPKSVNITAVAKNAIVKMRNTLHNLTESPSNKQQSPPDALPEPTSPIDEIKKMKELFDDGTITEEEFAAFKKKTLGI